MAEFLRDKFIENVTIDRDLLIQIDQEILRHIQSAPESIEQNLQNHSAPFIVYTIRFDGKGYRVSTINDLLSYFDQAKDIERVIFQIVSQESMNSNKVVGSYLDLNFDIKQESLLVVSSDNEAWMNNTFNSLQDIIFRNKNKHGWIRNAWVGLLIQLFAVMLGFAFSLWAATKIAPHLTIESAFIISFLLVLLIFSNIWTQIGARLANFLDNLFSAISFYRPKKQRLHWLMQIIIGSIVIAIGLFLLDRLFGFIGKMLGSFI